MSFHNQMSFCLFNYKTFSSIEPELINSDMVSPEADPTAEWTKASGWKGVEKLSPRRTWPCILWKNERELTIPQLIMMYHKYSFYLLRCCIRAEPSTGNLGEKAKLTRNFSIYTLVRCVIKLPFALESNWIHSLCEKLAYNFHNSFSLFQVWNMAWFLVNHVKNWGRGTENRELEKLTENWTHLTRGILLKNG